MRPQNQTLLCLILAFCMSTGFLGVFYVAETYEANVGAEASTMFISDSDMTFAEVDMSQTEDAVFGSEYGLGSYKYYYVSGGVIGSVVKNNATPVYIGNNTWGASMTGFAGETPLYGGAVHYIPIAIPDLKTFLIETINITVTLPNEPIRLTVAVGGNDYVRIPTKTYPTGVLLTNNVLMTDTEYEATYTLSAFQTLTAYNSCQNTDYGQLTIYVYDPWDIRDGLSSYGMQISVEITGTPVTTWSLQDSMSLVIGASLGINILVMIYMTDSIDFGWVKKDLGKNRKRR